MILKSGSKIYSLLLASLLICFIGYGQDIAKKSFPEAYFGTYKGDLKITNPKGSQTIPMEFHLKATDSVGAWVYTLVYGVGDQRQERLYTLKEINKEKGTYVVDENNGIILDAKVVENTLYSMFEVQGSLLTTTERFFEDHMIFEITVTNTQQKKTTGGISDAIPEVQSYPITVVQSARLIKE